MELLESIQWWPLWGGLGWRDIKHRYRHTLLGPFWLTLSMGLMIGTLGVLWAELFKVDVETMLPFVSSGLIAWTLIVTLVNEGCTAFTSFHTLKQLRCPYLICMFRVVWRNLIVFGHNLLIQVAVVVFLGDPISWSVLLLIPGLLLVLINALWFIALVGLICSRYRDVSQVIASLMQIAMFITPIFWIPSQAGKFHSYFVDGNIFYHLVELIRQPLLGGVPELWSYQFVAITAVVGWAVMALVYPRYRKLIPFWI